MSVTHTRRPIQLAVLLLAALAVAACGFHLRRNAALPPSMQRVHLSVNGGGDLQRRLARALEVSGVSVEDDAGAGIAELRVPTARFSTDKLSAGGYVRITEYAVHYQVQFDVRDGAGDVLVPHQQIDMSREYSYDASNTIGNSAQVEEIQRSLNDDMVQAILFRLQAAAHAPVAVPPAAPSTH